MSKSPVSNSLSFVSELQGKEGHDVPNVDDIRRKCKAKLNAREGSLGETCTVYFGGKKEGHFGGHMRN